MGVPRACSYSWIYEGENVKHTQNALSERKRNYEKSRQHRNRKSIIVFRVSVYWLCLSTRKYKHKKKKNCGRSAKSNLLRVCCKRTSKMESQRVDVQFCFFFYKHLLKADLNLTTPALIVYFMLVFYLSPTFRLLCRHLHHYYTYLDKIL